MKTQVSVLARAKVGCDSSLSIWRRRLGGWRPGLLSEETALCVDFECLSGRIVASGAAVDVLNLVCFLPIFL